MKRIDLHMHTTHSDGTYAPRDLIRYCKEKKLACVAVTDHDTLSSYEECADEAMKLGIELIPGIEISAAFEPGTLHILGYFLDRNHPKLKRSLEEVQAARKERNPQIIEKLNRAGVDITLDEVFEEASRGTSNLSTKQVGRPHFAQVLVRKKVVSNLKEAFEHYLAKGRPAYVDKRRLSSREAIQLIREAGGVTSVAHPKQMRLSEPELEKEIDKLKNEGLDAIEVYNSSQNQEDNRLFTRLAKDFQLLITGGSDFHGANKPGIDLGFMGKDITLNNEVIDAMKERIASRK